MIVWEIIEPVIWPSYDPHLLSFLLRHIQYKFIQNKVM